MGQEAEVPDAHEAFREQVQQESAQEFVERYSQQLLFIVVSRIAPAKGHLFIGERDEPMIGDRYAMSVTAQNKGGYALVLQKDVSSRPPSRFGNSFLSHEEKS